MTIWKTDLGLTTPYRITGEKIESAENAFVLCRADNGIRGIGAACPMPEVTGETMEATLQALEMASEMLRNRPLASPADWTQLLVPHMTRTPAALAAVDMALYDLMGNEVQTSVAVMLGQRHQGLPTSVTIGIAEEHTTRDRLRMLLSRGFHVIKLKIGEDPDRDIAMTRKLREWGGNTFELRVDANQGYSPDQLRHYLHETRDAGITLIEQPFPAPGMDALFSLPADICAICMADEDLITPEDAGALATTRSYGAWNIKLMKSGGITTAREMAEIAGKAGIRVMWGCNDESRVSIAAALHVAMSCQATRWLDLDGSFDLARDIATGGFVVERGVMYLTDKPGLGITHEANP